MKKILKVLLICVVAVCFFFFIDCSGVGLKERFEKAKDWANKK